MNSALGLRAAVELMRVTDVVLQAWLKHAPRRSKMPNAFRRF
jgi:hypothetical protein